jgi:COMPASS component SWD1
MTADASIKHLTPYPEEIDTNLDPLNGNANGCKFNRLGSMVAVSANDGRVAIMDYITGGNIKAWTAHARTVTSLSWSRDSRRLLTAATDGTVSLWNIEDTTRAANQYAFEGIGSPLTATFNPRNDNQILVFSPNFRSFVPLLLEFTAGGEKRIQLACDFPDESDDAFGAAAFDRRGEYVICGSAKGRIAVFDAKTGAMKRSVKQGSPGQQIKSIVVTRRGNYILTNSQLYIRCYELDQILSCPEGETIEPLQKFADTINKVM